MCTYVIQSINKQAESVRDYKRYLSSDPTPSDYSDIQAELTDYIEQKKAEMRNPAGSSAYTSHSSTSGGSAGSASARHPYAQPGAAPSSSKGPFPQPGASSSGAGGARPGSGGPSAGAGGAGLGSGKSPHPHANNYWQDDKEDFYSKFDRFKVSLHVNLRILRSKL